MNSRVQKEDILREIVFSMENFVDQTITRAEKHKNEVVTNLGIDDIRNALDFRKITIC